jgi:hypothetical protein
MLARNLPEVATTLHHPWFMDLEEEIWADILQPCCPSYEGPSHQVSWNSDTGRFSVVLTPAQVQDLEEEFWADMLQPCCPSYEGPTHQVSWNSDTGRFSVVLTPGQVQDLARASPGHCRALHNLAPTLPSLAQA